MYTSLHMSISMNFPFKCVCVCVCVLLCFPVCVCVCVCVCRITRGLASKPCLYEPGRFIKAWLTHKNLSPYHLVPPSSIFLSLLLFHPPFSLFISHSLPPLSLSLSLFLSLSLSRWVQQWWLQRINSHGLINWCVFNTRLAVPVSLSRLQ